MSANVGKLCCGKTTYKHQLRRHSHRTHENYVDMLLHGRNELFFYKISIDMENLFFVQSVHLILIVPL